MTSDENETILRRYIEQAWGQQDRAAAEEVVAEDVIFHDQVRAGDLPPGRAGVLEVMQRMFTATPDLTMEVHDVVAAGDKLAVRYTATGTHLGDFNGFPATGRRFRMDALALVRMEDGRIVEGWQEADEMGLARQLGLMPKGRMPRPMAGAFVAAIRLKDRLARRDRSTGRPAAETVE